MAYKRAQSRLPQVRITESIIDLIAGEVKVASSITLEGKEEGEGGY